jgi:hypothetical protein
MLKRRAAATIDVPDPFQLLRDRPETMTTRLGALPRATLLNIIAASDLNPAGESLASLNDRQLVTFIVTAADAQLRIGRRQV